MQSIEGNELDMDIAMNFFRLKNGPDVEKIETYLQLSNEFLNKCKNAQEKVYCSRISLPQRKKASIT